MARLPRRTARRLGSALPERLQGLVRAVRAARGRSAFVEVPDASVALVVAAHPDDETLLAGGTIAVLATQGTVVDVLLATCGEATQGASRPPEQLGDARRTEAEAACKILGARHPTVLGYPDGGLSGFVDAFAEDVRTAVAETEPQMVITPWWLDGHSDHRAVAQAVAAADLEPSTTIWSGEIWTPLVPNRLVDITAVIDRKREAIRAHRTAMGALDLEAFVGLNRFRSLRGLGGAGYAEAFVVLNPQLHRELVTSSQA